MEVMMRFTGGALWDGGDAFPYPVPIPRVPVKGEKITLPDEHGWWEVVEVEYDYSHGLAREPVVGVVCQRPSDA